MRYLKVLGLAAVAATAIMAFGAGTASAVKLCANGTPADGFCGAGKKEFSGTVTAKTEGVRAWTLTTNVTTIHCDAHLTEQFFASTGTPISSEVTQLSLTNCQTSGGTGCSFETKNLPYSASLTSSTSLTVTDPVGTGWLVKCGFLINCEFSTKEANLSVVSGNPTKVVAKEVKLTRSGGFCPETSELHTAYTVTSPSGFTVF